MTDPRQAIIRLPSGLHIRLQLLGAGPPVMMLHESPRSSNALLSLAKRLCQQFTCIMMDTPGFGYSDPLALARPEIADYALVALDVADALGLDRVPFYGTHTGAAIAAEAAVLAPDRVSAAVLDGYALFDAAERDELLASYLPPLRPTIDGSHVAWLWARIRDQFTAFPWNRVGDGSRLPFGPPPLASMNAVADDFLLAGDHYRAAYAAAFRYDHLEPLRHVTVPVRLATREDDMLFTHMERARGVSDQVTLTQMSADRDAWGRTIAALLGDHVEAEAVDADSLLRRSENLAGNRQIRLTDSGPVLLRVEGEGKPVVLIHDVPGDHRDLDHVAMRLARSRQVIRFDLPGLGALRRSRDHHPTVDRMADAATQALTGLLPDQTPVVAFGASIPVAARISDTNPLIAVDPWTAVFDAAASEVPDLSQHWDGTHLMSAFWWARDQAVYKPWYVRDNAKGRPIGNERDIERIHNRFCAIALAGSAGADIARLQYGHDLFADVKQASGRTQMLIVSKDPDAEAQRDWSLRLLPGNRIHSVSNETWPLVRKILELCG